MTPLFSPLSLRSVTLRNRIGVSPMCQYSCVDGHMNDWHVVHLGSRAVGGAGLVIAEATAVLPQGRITPDDAGLWADSQVEPMARVMRFVRGQGATPAVQLAHAGRKASCASPWLKRPGTLPAAERGWEPEAPSAEAFDAGYATPRELDAGGIAALVGAFAAAAGRALAAGCEMIEIHAAHGYLLHEFHSPFANHRGDEFGGDFAGRTRLTRQIVAAIRKVWPERLPLAIRFSCTDWADGGWTLEETIELSRQLKGEGVDLVDCSSGGINTTAGAAARSKVGPGFQVPFAEAIRREAGVATAAVGMITEPAAANEIVAGGRADVVLLARQLLRDPYWPIRAARELAEPQIPMPVQYAHWVR